MLAPGLKEKSGRAGELCSLKSVLLLAPKAWPGKSIADLGRRPAVRDVIGLDADMVPVAGKTNGGFGGGPEEERGDKSGVSAVSFGSLRLRLGPSGSERWRGL